MVRATAFLPSQRTLFAAFGMLLFLTVWFIAAQQVGKPQIVPLPAQVLNEGLRLSSDPAVLGHLATSLKRLGIGFVLGAGLALVLALLAAGLRPLRAFINVPVGLSQPIPPLAVLPIFLFLLGIGEELPISVVAFVAFKPVYIATLAAATGVERAHLEAAKVFGARAAMVAREVVLPAAAPQIFAGLRIAMALSWMSIIAAEMIGTSSGIGFSIMYDRQFVLVNKVILGMVLIGITGALLDWLLLTIEKRLTPWRPNPKG